MTNALLEPRFDARRRAGLHVAAAERLRRLGGAGGRGPSPTARSNSSSLVYSCLVCEIAGDACDEGGSPSDRWTQGRDPGATGGGGGLGGFWVAKS